MPEASSFFRPGRLLRAGAAFAVLIALAGYLVAQYSSGRRAQARCQVESGKDGGGVYRLSAEQAVNTATISAVGTSRGMPEQAVTIALATALQESNLENLDHGDRDSLGLFQQRPSQGWGTKAQIMDTAYAAGQFYAHLAKVPDYDGLPLTVAAQRVQHSAFPDAYAKHEQNARLLAEAFTGRAPGTLSCTGGFNGAPGDPEKVRRALVRDFGSEVLAPVADTPGTRATNGSDEAAGTDEANGTGGTAGTAGTNGSGTGAGGRSAGGGTGAGAGAGPSPSAPSARPPARTVTVPVPAAAGTGKAATEGVRRGWELAHWAVANSAALGIARVDYAGRRWSSDRDGVSGGWGAVPGSRGAARVSAGPGKPGPRKTGPARTAADGGAGASFGEVLIVTAG